MNITIEQNNGIQVIALEGEVDMHQSPELRAKINELLKANATKLCFDLKKVKYMDSSGIATLVEAMQKLHDTKGELRLASIPKPIYSIFEIAKLDMVFNIYPDVEAALEGF